MVEKGVFEVGELYDWLGFLVLSSVFLLHPVLGVLDLSESPRSQFGKGSGVAEMEGSTKSTGLGLWMRTSRRNLLKRGLTLSVKYF